jgi:hypothetical protein
MAERNGERCAGPVILAGLLIGLRMVQLASGPMAQTSRFSLELLILLALAWLLPRWMARIELKGQVSWSRSVPAAVVVGALLLLMFFVAAVCGGVLATPRADLVDKFRDLLAGVLLIDVTRACLRAGVFLGLLCA